MKKIAIYPGTFDPITNGHHDIIKRSSILFDELIIAITNDNNKKVMFDISQRIEMVKKILENGFAYEINGSVYLDVNKYNQKYLVYNLHS